MSAKHPITGAPIRIMRTGTQLWKDGKTLFWARTKHQAPIQWQIITVGLEDTQKFSPSICIFTEMELGLKDFLISSSAKTKNIILLTKAIIEEITLEFMKEHTLQNILCLDELGQLYPHAFDGTPHTYWNGTPEHAVFLVGVILRFTYLAGFPIESQISNKYIEYLPPSAAPRKLWLIQQYYEPDQSRRAKEIRTCLQKNIDNPFIDKILLLNEKDLTYKLPKSSKIEQIVIGNRLYYSDVLRTIYEKVPPNTLVAFANSDIYFDESIQTLWSLKMENKFLALLRYDAQPSTGEEPKLFGPRADSQDSWIVLSDSIKAAADAMPNLNKLQDFDFPFGKSGCDNAIAYEMLRKKFLVANPAYSIRTIHLHTSGIRTYEPKDIIEKPVFLYIDPTVIHEFQTQTDFAPYKLQNKIRTYKFPDAFQTKDGLVYGYNTLYIENNEQVKALWTAASAKISTLVPYLNFEKSIAIPIDDTLADRFAKPEEYILFYLSRILAIRQTITGPNTAFWGPTELPDTKPLDWLRLFSWSEGQNPIPVISREKISQLYSKECYYAPLRSTTVPHKEDIAALRSAFLYEIDVRNADKKVIIVQNGIFTENLIAEIEENLIQLGYNIYVYYLDKTDVQYIPNIFKNGTVLIGASTAQDHYKVFGNMWMMPPGGKVIEFVGPDIATPTPTKNLSEVCDHTYIQVAASQPNILETICKMMGAQEIIPKPALPIFKLPTNQQGLHSHANDSFRELAQLWQEAGLVSIEPTIVPFCSLDGTILYDRPTYKWLDSLPPQLQPPIQQKILVGNPAPKLGTAMRPWIFWARSPRKLQEAVDANLPETSYKDRNISCVFIGNIENQIQAAAREASWETACDKWHLTKGSKHALSQKEYFQALATSKFGLCLSGYGKKCHREIECMAMGTVPVCSLDVDTENYVEPLKEGIHFLRAANPEEAKEKIAAVSQSTWEEMSAACRAWWQKNASIEGSFKVTMANL